MQVNSTAALLHLRLLPLSLVLGITGFGSALDTCQGAQNQLCGLQPFHVFLAFICESCLERSIKQMRDDAKVQCPTAVFPSGSGTYQGWLQV